MIFERRDGTHRYTYSVVEHASLYSVHHSSIKQHSNGTYQSYICALSLTRIAWLCVRYNLIELYIYIGISVCTEFSNLFRAMLFNEKERSSENNQQ